MTKLLAVPANVGLTIWATSDPTKCDPNDPSKYGGATVTTFAPGDIVAFAQLGLRNPANGIDNPKLVFTPIAPTQSPNSAVRYLHGVTGSAAAGNTLSIQVSELGKLGKAFWGDYLVKDAALTTVTQDVKKYLYLPPNLYHASVVNDATMNALLSLVTALPSASPQSSGAFTIYLTGSLVDGAFPVHSLGCDDNMEVGNYNACLLN